VGPALTKIRAYLDRAGLVACLIGAGLTLTGIVDVWVGFGLLFFALGIALTDLFSIRLGRYRLAWPVRLVLVGAVVSGSFLVLFKPMAGYVASKKENPLTVAQVREVLYDVPPGLLSKQRMRLRNPS